MRGLYTATVLDALSQHFASRRNAAQLDVGRGFDLVTGTSTGGIIACGLAFGLSTAELIHLFRTVGPLVFKNPMPNRALAFASWALRHLHRSANSDENLRAALAEQFGHATLQGVFRERGVAVCVPSVNLSTCQSIVFKTPHQQHFTRDGRLELVDVCLSTSAAPIYLPLAAIKHPDDEAQDMILTDGGLWANNPVLVGLIEGLSLAGSDRPIEILSVSTCPSAQGTLTKRRDRSWGLFRWRAGTTALTMSLESQSWGYYHMALKLAEVLRGLGRQCRVIRLPHSAPSIQQSVHLGLDRASPEAMTVLADLGRNDGDFDRILATLGATEASIVADVFGDMPLIGEGHLKASTTRRRAERIPKNILIDDRLQMTDESEDGAAFITNTAPVRGTQMSYTLDGKRVFGTVRWVHPIATGKFGFGIEKLHRPQA